MPITLTRDLDVITLPPDLLWEDEFAWSPISQSTERSLTGALLIDVSARQGGMPITLTGTERHAWLLRTEVQALRAWVALPGQVFTLTINGQAFTVLFDHGTDETSRAFVVSPLIDFSDPQPQDYYCSVTLRFITKTP
jgi:hypothetical protein